MDLIISIYISKRNELVPLHTTRSVHPKNRIRGLIGGCLRAYWLQNTPRKDFYKMAILLACQLIVRSYTLENLLSLLQYQKPDSPTYYELYPRTQML
jgi:hypothetical protein